MTTSAIKNPSQVLQQTSPSEIVTTRSFQETFFSPWKIFGYTSSNHVVAELYFLTVFLVSSTYLLFLMHLQADLNEAARLAALEAERLFQESRLISSVKADGKRGFALFLFVLSSSIWLPTVAAAPPAAALIVAPAIACGFIDFFSKDPRL